VQSDSAWRTLVSEVLDAPALLDEQLFSTNVGRVAHRRECDSAVAGRTCRFTTAELTERLAVARVPAAQVSLLDQVVDHPQLRARDRWRTVGTEHAEVAALLPPVTFSDVEARMGDVPALGEHTRVLLLESGLDEAAADDLLRSGVAFQPSPRHPAAAG
jgi:crotonobetainyl-CoA:carnitine CoA-transferase CaiB-like acyl-CoA transferase